MKKKVLGLALMAMALVGFNGMAQNATQNCNAQSCKTQTECKKDKKGMAHNKGDKEQRKGDRKGSGKRAGANANSTQS